MKPLVGPAIAAIKNGDARFIPQRWEKNYFHWMENLEDWCVSRQIWWGHRIPVWYCECGETIVSMEDPTACPSCGTAELIQDQDVLDTWFSSALWPFSTLGWPEETSDLDRYYPTNTLVTGFDIIFFWVARNLDTSATPREVYDRVEMVLVDAYGHVDEGGRASSQDRSVKVDFPDPDDPSDEAAFAVDAVPAVRDGSRWAIPSKDRDLVGRAHRSLGDHRPGTFR